MGFVSRPVEESHKSDRSIKNFSKSDISVQLIQTDQEIFYCLYMKLGMHDKLLSSHFFVKPH